METAGPAAPTPNNVFYATPSKSPAGRTGPVVDGDTLYVRATLADEVMVLWRARLAGLDCPELSRPGGPEAKRFVEDWLPADGRLVVLFHGRDNYGRALLTVFRGEDPVSLNDALLSGGHATVVSLTAQLEEEGGGGGGGAA